MSQKTDAQLLTQKDVIKNETIANANTALRIGQMHEDVIDSKINKLDAYTAPFPQVTASGTNTYAATAAPAITAYATGQKFQIKFTNASSGVSTLNLNALGAKKIFANPTTQATTGHILAGQISLLVYDAALDAAAGGFLMIGVPATTSGTVTSVTGTTNRITSSGGATPVIDIDAAYDATHVRGRPAVAATGAVVSFAIPQYYGSAAAIAGNITFSTTGAVLGMEQVMVHNDSVEPSFPSEFKRMEGSRAYVTSIDNFIYMKYLSATKIQYTINQEQ